MKAGVHWKTTGMHPSGHQPICIAGVGCTYTMETPVNTTMTSSPPKVRRSSDLQETPTCSVIAVVSRLECIERPRVAISGVSFTKTVAGPEAGGRMGLAAKSTRQKGWGERGARREVSVEGE